ncbi:hypothetical protein ACH4E7_18860 [Kitasatospora sp. NPDC018058]|uniref:hypothetical protein n=1 Tax=Kitasatospora sp. NPDC018058 TaxID=3364025 RepID=UPI0037C0D263
MRRLTAACLLVAAAAALTGCASTTPASSKAVATAAVAATTEAAAPPASSSASGSPSPSGSTSAVQAWALKSSQFNTVTSAVIPMAGTITSANGDAKAVGKACTAMAATVNGLQPEAGAPQEWAQVLSDLQKVATRCDAVTSGDPAAYEQLDQDFADAMAHLEPLVG